MAWRLPTRVVVEPGCLGAAASHLGELAGASRALLVLDPGLAATPWPGRLAGALRAAGLTVLADEGLEANPRTATAERLGERARAERIDLVVALGGGSALDAAKAAAVLATDPRPAVELAGRERFAAPPLPVVACPTTCGTGSEVTWVAVLTDPAAGRKISLKGERMFPRLALVDPDTLATLPPRQVAWTAMDAMTHAVEATTCRFANPVSDALAAQAIGLLFAWLPRAVADPAGDGAARGAVALASTLAGMAFGNADVAAVHCLSEAIGGLLDLPHGLLNATLLVPVLRHQRAAIAPPLAALAGSLGAPGGTVDEAAGAFLDRLTGLAADLAIPPFAGLGIDRGHHAAIAREAAANGSNPANRLPLDEAGYRALLAALG